jgi:hypothetical protein
LAPRQSGAFSNRQVVAMFEPLPRSMVWMDGIDAPTIGPADFAQDLGVHGCRKARARAGSGEKARQDVRDAVLQLRAGAAMEAGERATVGVF